MPPRPLRAKLAPKPKLLAVDLDGTLLDPTGKPHAEDVRALRALAETGTKVSILTGRLYSGTRTSAEALGVDGPVGCVDGSHMVDAREHKTLFHHGIRGAHAITLRDSLARAGAATFLFAKDAIVHDPHGDPFVHYVTTWSTDVERADSLVDHGAWHGDDGVTAVVAVGPGDRIALAVDLIRRGLSEVAQVAMFPIKRVTGAWGLVARASGGTKGSALTWLADHHGITVDETVVVGDWLNDVPMFGVAGRSFAMGHAPDEVKRAATDVLPETAEQGGGIARIVREVFGVSTPRAEPQ